MITYLMREDFLQSYLQKTMLISNADIKLAHGMFTNQDDDDSILSISDDGTTATIAITGILSLVGPSFIDRFFGYSGTGYKEIVNAVNKIMANSRIETVRLMIISPGGSLIGLGEAYQALVNLAKEKKLIAENHGEMSSAAYYLAVAAPTIIATSDLALTGSIGVVVGGIDYTQMLKNDGIKKITILSKHAKNKHPDMATSHGERVIQDEIDSIERIFLKVAAIGRNTTVEDVKNNFGKGAVFVARDPDNKKPDALSVGMIDSVLNVDNPINEVIIDNDEETEMDITELKTKHPDIYALAVNEGAVMERERVTAHLSLGNASKDMKLAMSNIKDGIEHNATSNAGYMASQLNAQSISDNTDDNIGELDLELNSGDGDSELTIALAEKLGVELLP